MSDPSTDRFYSLHEVARIVGVEPSQLRRWDRSGLLRAGRVDGRTLRYTFRDLITARAAAALIRSGVRSAQVRRTVIALRAWRPDLELPLSQLRVFSEGDRLLVVSDGAVMEPLTGQLVLDLPLKEVAERARVSQSNVLTVPARRRRLPTPPPRDPHAFFEAGLEAEARGAATEAHSCYEEALELDPEHPGVLLNLGNIVYERGELERALALYRRGVEVAGDLPEAHYNLGNVLDDLDQPDAAIGCYETALALDARFKAAHFNAALVWEKMARPERARPHWRRYLDLDAHSESAAVARGFLQGPAD